MKKKVMLLVDTLIVIFLSIQIQSTIVFIEERFSYLQNYTWDDLCVLVLSKWDIKYYREVIVGVYLSCIFLVSM